MQSLLRQVRSDKIDWLKRGLKSKLGGLGIASCPQLEQRWEQWLQRCLQRTIRKLGELSLLL